MPKSLLTHIEVTAIEAMEPAWTASLNQNDSVALRAYLAQLIGLLGTRLLFVVAAYAKIKKEQ